jgi:hypothetical protein
MRRGWIRNVKSMNDVKRTERGWAGHYCCADQCLFRRNTLLEHGDVKVVVSTVGNRADDKGLIVEIGSERYYETMVFHAHLGNGYWDADVTRQVQLKTKWQVTSTEYQNFKSTIDTVANDMHENAVTSIAMDMLHDELEYVTW